jgi:hypothetical protein
MTKLPSFASVVTLWLVGTVALPVVDIYQTPAAPPQKPARPDKP